ncbi:MAG TPA: hypothetical protein PLE45_09755 [Spirochaetota bacterium]|nr:hypothetical protein [Spirochaetota bacterium]HOL57376.1 hypothetical protein [Spirochaetota bacterium]HPP04935.1 hypothetical protein [Spirochaetota bacterium]
MKNQEEIRKMQEALIEKLIADAKQFIDSIDMTEIQTVLLSGSVSRGDFFPGKFGGMIDLIVMRKPGSTVSAESLFGKDEEPDIPYHCITVNSNHFQILLIDFVDAKVFPTFEEPMKYALLESSVLWDHGDTYTKELETIKRYATIDQRKQLDNCLGYIGYLLSDYKKDRWYRRDAFCQMHENLNTSIRLMIQCLYYINGKYAPSEDRRLYYSYSLPKIPQNYEDSMHELFKQDISSEEDYYRREELFKSRFMEFMMKNRPITAST